MSHSLKVPKNIGFLDPMLLSIWELSGGEPYKAVPLKEVLNKTLIKVGLDPTKETLQGPEGWSLKLRMLFRSYMEGVPSQNPSYVALQGYGKWSITPLGLAYLRDTLSINLNNPPKTSSKSEPNETSLWLNSNYTKLYKYLLKNLPKSLKMSATLGSIEDHIQTFFIKIITNNALKAYIKEDRQINFSMLNAWAIRSAYSEFTTMGQEPVERVMRNAKTETELTIEKAINKTEAPLFDWTPVAAAPTYGYEISIQNSGDLDSSSMNYDSDGFDFEIYSSENQEDRVLSKLSFDKNFTYIKGQIFEAFSRSKDQDLAVKVFEDMILTNKNIQEIAESNATATSKIYSIMNKIKEESSKAYKKGMLEV